MSEDGDWAIACGKDGCRHIDQNVAEMIWAEVEGQRRTRAANMPTEQRAISALFEAWYRLKELGWREACYVPRDGRLCEFVECGSTGIHQGHADEKGRIWLHADGDLWPSTSVLFRILPEQGRCPMTEAGWTRGKEWAKEIAGKFRIRVQEHGPEPLVQVTTVATLLQAEHARSVRIVKRAERMELRKVLDTDTNEYLAGYQQAVSDILAALQKGRA